MKKLLIAAALMAALITVAAAQNSRLPQASLDREVDVRVSARAAVLGNPPRQPAPKEPSYCKPCLFYAGDFDSTARDAGGLANEMDITISSGAAVYAPFIVPEGKTWRVLGLFTDNFMSTQTLDPATSPYEIRKGIPAAGGSGGKLVCHGTLPATAIPTGLSDFGFNIYAVSVKGIRKCWLKEGKYWASVVPFCTNPHDSDCTNGWRSFEANDDGAMANHVGKPEPANMSFFNSVFFGATWSPSSNFQSSSRFSDGVIGTHKP